MDHVCINLYDAETETHAIVGVGMGVELAAIQTDQYVLFPPSVAEDVASRFRGLGWDASIIPLPRYAYVVGGEA